MDGNLLTFITREKTTKRRPNRDETLPIINKPKYQKKKKVGEEETRNKMEG
jgi:hypothetical protein